MLQQAGHRSGADPAPGELDRYDRFFLTERAQVCVHDARAQFRDRIVAMTTDIAAHSLNYRGPPVSSSVSALRRPGVAALERRSAEVLLQVRKLIREDT